MPHFLIRFIVTLLLFLAIDSVWLVRIAPNFYKTHIGHLLGETIVWWAAGLFYLIFIVGLLLFVIVPALEKASAKYAAYRGALFGLVTYATYDLTNQATLRDWPLIVVIVDLTWGTVLSASVAFFSYLVLSRWNRMPPQN
jgi:uncharacterized membrane protein